MVKMEFHHTKYKEIHGVDEGFWLTASKHKRLHCRLRIEGKCKIPSMELNKFSVAAANRRETKENKRHRVMKWRYSSKITAIRPDLMSVLG
jgi:hypothetical protein